MKNTPTILLCLYYPIFMNHQAGGAQSHLRLTLPHLVDEGFKFEVLCPSSKKHEMFSGHGISVHPILKDLADNNNLNDHIFNLQQFRKYSSECDLIWVVDRPFPIKTEKPIVLKSNAFCYQNEINALLSKNITAITTLSDYATGIVTNLRSIVEPNQTPTPVRTATPFIENRFKRYVDLDTVKKYFDYKPDQKYILFPHRPDSGKNHARAFDILFEIIKLDSQFKMLVPLPPTSLKKDIIQENNYIAQIKEQITRQKLSDHVIFHDWIDHQDMPAYFSIGHVTLYMSTLPETFGISAAQSIACGTPVCSTGAGALQSMVKPDMGHSIIGNRSDKEIAQEIVSGKALNDVKKGELYIREKYSRHNTIDSYKNLFMTLIDSRAT